MSSDNTNETCIDNKCSIAAVASEQPIGPAPSAPTKIPFWSEDPNMLLKPEYLFEFFPTENMSYEQKLNAITRLIIVLTLVGFAVSQNVRLLIVSVITITAIYLYYVYQKKEMQKKEGKKVRFENFETASPSSLSSLSGPVAATLKHTGRGEADLDPAQVFEPPSAQNPFSNVMMTDYDYNPNKKPAAPSFNENINHDIMGQAKQLVRNANPDQPDIADKLFKDLGDQLYFEQSLRPFNSNPSTTIPNDQGAFADFCFGGFISAKEGNSFALARNLSRYQNV